MTRCSVVCLLSLLIASYSCKNDPSKEGFNDEVRIRLAGEPDRLNPILSKQSEANQIERWLFSTLQDYDPATLELTPVLLANKPTITETGDGLVRFDMRMRSDAVWDNGDPITGKDYLFTMKASLVPGIDNTSWSTFVRQLTDIKIDPNDPRQFTVLVDGAYMQAEEIITGFPVYPKYHYDNAGLLDDISFAQLHSSDTIGLQENLHRFRDEFNDIPFSRTNISGSGAYRLVLWESQQSLTLQRKESWWGHGSQHPLLKAMPTRITYYFIPDEQTALTSLKDQGLDLVADISPEPFVNLLSNTSFEDKLATYTPAVLQYFYIAHNNDHPILSDLRVRKALAHVLDLETLIQKLFYNQAQPIISPIHPSKQVYIDSLQPLALDLEKASDLLRSAGWTDLDQDGVAEKNIAGKKVDLSLSIFTTRSQLSQDVAVLLQQGAADVGMKIDIVPRDFSSMLEDVRTGKYDMACLASRPPVGDYDPYPNWHSDNIGPTGNNLCKFANPKMDAIVDAIRFSRDRQERNRHYVDFQRLIYQEQPALFLVAPSMRIAANKNLSFLTSSMRPGYFENTMSRR